MDSYYLNEIFLGVAAFTIIHNAWAVANIIWTRNWLELQRNLQLPENPETFIVILLPMLNEQTIVTETINHFASLNYPRNKMRVILVTSAREIGCNAKSTGDVVKKFLHNTPLQSVLHFETDGNDECKADQLNQVMKWLDVESPTWWKPDVMIGVYDADSRPETDSLRDLDRAVNENPDAFVFQQPTVYVSGFFHVSSGLRRCFLQSRPLYNLRFCLFREIPAYHRSTIAQRNNSRVFRALIHSPNHLLGHGEFIRHSMLHSFGGFPPPSGDTSLGTIVSYSGQAVVPLSTFDFGETPGSVEMLIHQGCTWYAGCALYLRDLKWVLSKGENLKLTHFIMCFKRWLENMIWCVGPLVITLSLSWAIVSRDLTLAMLCICGGALHYLSLQEVIRTYDLLFGANYSGSLNRMPTAHDFKRVLWVYPFMLLACCAGPILFYFYWLRRAISGQEIPRSKTERLLQ